MTPISRLIYRDFIAATRTPRNQDELLKNSVADPYPFQKVIPLFIRLESLICRVGEKSTSSLESNLEGLAAVLEADLPNYKSNILKILATCAIKLPEKLTVYSTLVGLLNAKNYNFGGDFVDLLCRHLKDALKKGNFREAWNICRLLRLQVHALIFCRSDDRKSSPFAVLFVSRFLSDLVNCHVIVAASLLYLYENFVAVCREENGTQVRADSYLYLVLASLPWVSRPILIYFYRHGIYLAD